MIKVLVLASGMTLIGAGASLASTVSTLSELTEIRLNFEKVDVNYTSNGLTVPGQISPVPLPAAGWMLLAGLGGIVALRRRAKA